ncbi:MarR family winged helix-turn-helix transcriptional regulator [Aureimonas sp. AU40]|uniref:MarR family winged helix-turn-helix transcriptional regulator n=1 Tax=Aureimonas sp. AU40 TaxID=1637747 RepID=UPI0007805BE2|nr:MarR family winged helix-turn-helix transcriptional regulator [Aureimonas sp. AU40]
MQEATIARLTAINNVLVEYGLEMPSPPLKVFLEVAEKPGITHRDIVERTGIPGASVSRYVSILSNGMTWGGAGALDLVEAAPDPNNRRSQLVKPTEKGQALMKRLGEILEA